MPYHTHVNMPWCSMVVKSARVSAMNGKGIVCKTSWLLLVTAMYPTPSSHTTVTLNAPTAYDCVVLGQWVGRGRYYVLIRCDGCNSSAKMKISGPSLTQCTKRRPRKR